MYVCLFICNVCVIALFEQSICVLCSLFFFLLLLLFLLNFIKNNFCKWKRKKKKKLLLNESKRTKKKLLFELSNAAADADAVPDDAAIFLQANNSCDVLI